MSKELFFIGAPAQFKAGILIYPPSLKEVIVNNKYTVFIHRVVAFLDIA